MAKFLFLEGTGSVTAINIDQITTLVYGVGEDCIATLSSGQTIIVDDATRNVLDKALRQESISRPASAKVLKSGA